MAATFSSLPVEIQRCCVNYLDTAALKSIRLASPALRDIATEALFETAALQLTEQSADNFTTLLTNDKFRRYIRKLYTQLEGEYLDDDCHPSPPPGWWTEAVTKWSGITLPNLKALVLDSAFSCSDSHCAELGLAFSAFLSTADMDTLTIQHLQDTCRLQRPDLTKIGAKPKKLHLLVTTFSSEACPDTDIELRHRHALFNINLNATWLAPTHTRLTHLTLHCNTYWGVYPRWQPSNLHFPQLKSLALGKWTVAFDWQIDFITSHGQTLDQLILSNCPILHASRMIQTQTDNAWQRPIPGTGRGRPRTTTSFSDLRWHTVLPHLKTKLVKLRHFSMGRGPISDYTWDRRSFSDDDAFEHRYGLTPRIDSSRYALFDCGQGPIEWGEPDPERSEIYANGGWGWTSWMEWEADEAVRKKAAYPDCLHEDQEALADLLETLRHRQ